MSNKNPRENPRARLVRKVKNIPRKPAHTHSSILRKSRLFSVYVVIILRNRYDDLFSQFLSENHLLFFEYSKTTWFRNNNSPLKGILNINYIYFTLVLRVISLVRAWSLGFGKLSWSSLLLDKAHSSSFQSMPKIIEQN